MAKLLQLGISGGPIETGIVQPQVKAAAAAPRKADLNEYGASGTPIFGGFLRERGEYNADLIGLDAVYTYEKMRRSDAQVAATLSAIKLPILAAQWDVTVPDDASDVEKEAAEFARECLFSDIDFNAVLRNALLMLDFGFACHEQVWEVVGNRVRLKKLAPRLPITAYRWLTDETGEGLAALEQMGYRGDQYLVAQVPANKMDLFTMHQEGANYTGLSLMRAMYQHWYIKSNLYKVDAIACERNGMGVPVITMGRDAKTEDRLTAQAWIESLVTHQKTGLLLPPEWTFKLEGVTGQVRDCKDSIAHHNAMISMVGLTAFLQLGQGSRGGSRSLGDTLADFFYMSLQSVTEQISRVLSLGTVKRLVDFNFAGIEHYPVIKAQQILTVKFDAIVTALSQLALAGVIEPDDTLESWMREKMAAPPVDKATVRPVPGGKGGAGGVTPEAPGGAAGANAGAPKKRSGEAKDNADGTVDVGAPADGGEGGVEAESGVAQPTAAEVNAAAMVIRQAMGEFERRGRPTAGRQAKACPTLRAMDVSAVHVEGMGGLKLKRQPRGAEIHLALHDIASTLDKGRDDVAAALRAARPRIQAELIHKVINRPVGQMHRATVDADAKLVAQVAGLLGGVSDFGHDQVRKERAKQRAGAPAPDAATVRMADARTKDPIGLYADGVVSQFTNTLGARATNAAIDRKRKGGTDGEVIQGVQQDLDGQSDKWIDSVAAKGANEAFGEGRSAGFAEYADEIDHYIYSALLDLNTCGNCAAADGAEGDSEGDVPDVPNPDCDGGDLCRCVVVAVFKDEGSKT